MTSLQLEVKSFPWMPNDYLELHGVNVRMGLSTVLGGLILGCVYV